MEELFRKELNKDETILWTGEQKNGNSKIWLSLTLTILFILLLGLIVYKFSPENLVFYIFVAVIIAGGFIKTYMPMLKKGTMETYALTNKRLIIYGVYTKVQKNKMRSGMSSTAKVGFQSYYYDELCLNKTKSEMIYQIKLEKDNLVFYQYSHMYKKITCDDIENAWKIIKKYVK